ALRSLFNGAGFKAAMQADIQGWLRNHFIMNVAMEIEVLRSGSFKAAAASREALVNMSHSVREMIPILKAKGSRPDAQTKLLSLFPPKLFGFIMGNLVFSPKGMPYAVVEHNHYQVGASVKEMIAEAKKRGINAPRLFAAESLIAK
ncbi:MAG: ketopantoate reductase family protein, partial [Clostridiales bacterium]|nr:ketopantoate reductase family protein [Clostridiales bacterium]